MVKIIKQGKKPKKYKTIYTATCPDCGCEFEFELSDVKRTNLTLDGARMFIGCPCCGVEICTAGLKTLKTREEEVVETPIPTIYPSTGSGDWSPNSWSDPCSTCPNKDGPKDALGRPVVGDSPCSWCPHYKYRVTWCLLNESNSCVDEGVTYTVDLESK